MITLNTWFWIMLVIFGLIGMFRGWTREIIATAGLVLSLFALLWFGPYLINPLTANAVTDTEAMESQFYICSLIHLLFAFFSYQGPALVRQVSGGRFGDKARGNIQESLLGFIVGMINGYLVVGALWSFLEYNIPAGIAYTPGLPYPFPVEVITRPAVGSAAFELISNLPLPLLASWLPFLVVLLFLFVIIAMI